MTPLQLTRSVRSLNRIRQIAQVLTQHGFGHIVARIDLTRFVPVWMMRKKAAPPPRETPVSLGQRLASVCAELGPTFVKLGQMLTTRPDILPAEVLEGLHSLQDEVPPFDTDSARQIIAEELGCPAEECFASFEDEPIACGSIGQVYRARTVAGDRVVVKVRRPGIDDIIKLDMRILKWLAESLENLIPELSVYHPAMIIREFEQLLNRELDYINEGSATDTFAHAFADSSIIRIPRVHWDLCGSRVLTLGEIPGRNIETFLRGDRSETPDVIDRAVIARNLMEAYLDQIFNLGVLHTDPHPGNILIEPPSGIGLIDFGQVTTISNELMMQIVVIVYGAVNKQVDLIVETMADMNALSAATDRNDLQRDVRALLDKYYGLPLKRFDIGTVVSEFTDAVRQHDVIVPREAISLAKAVGMVAGLATKLDPQLDVMSLIKPRIKRALREQLSPKRLARTALVSGWNLVGLLRHAPSSLRQLMQRLATGTWELNIKHENLDRLANELDRSSNRLSFSVVIAAIIVGSSIVISANSDLTVFGVNIQWLGIVGYIIAGVLGIALSWAIFRSGRLH